MSEHLLLALDASSSACSVALWRGDASGRGELFQRYEIAPRQHTQKLLPMVDAVLGEAGVALSSIDALAYGHGPGSFTGIRIAAGVAQGLAFGAGRALLGVSTLEALALDAYLRHGTELVLAALDARMGELYTGAFRIEREAGWIQAVGLDGEQVIEPSALRLPAAVPGDFFGAGAGFGHLESFDAGVRARITRFEATLEPDARAIALIAARGYFLGLARPPAEVQPVYLRNEVASRSQRGPLD
ncbi:tRNA (adenosine(37)-N6)-threonylcarbamoyltransferase complex dimerization subunit type 1 TsaB [Halotalea alkalilenta]|uniref:tRNA threonylcarbamoyladenosine biosynthesis protein TsaB n=1 Tax=Halotalea alkalilenta TaxID=376489 RepID=A0A172YHQ5_9GAMM|nr:tRNA (adenosine(37)-N6)-threonylcarbamoyltransferase complex dimerization subunit type 1 TsaB [Halotalea alkalilenta]ANF58788.1 hypothetical protein A5892_16050 [Halotalea alkalilenta]